MNSYDLSWILLNYWYTMKSTRSHPNSYVAPFILSSHPPIALDAGDFPRWFDQRQLDHCRHSSPQGLLCSFRPERRWEHHPSGTCWETWNLLLAMSCWRVLPWNYFHGFGELIICLKVKGKLGNSQTNQYPARFSHRFSSFLPLNLLVLGIPMFGLCLAVPFYWEIETSRNHSLTSGTRWLIYFDLFCLVQILPGWRALPFLKSSRKRRANHITIFILWIRWISFLNNILLSRMCFTLMV